MDILKTILKLLTSVAVFVSGLFLFAALLGLIPTTTTIVVEIGVCFVISGMAAGFTHKGARQAEILGSSMISCLLALIVIGGTLTGVAVFAPEASVLALFLAGGTTLYALQSYGTK